MWTCVLMDFECGPSWIFGARSDEKGPHLEKMVELTPTLAASLVSALHFELAVLMLLFTYIFFEKMGLIPLKQNVLTRRTEPSTP